MATVSALTAGECVFSAGILGSLGDAIQLVAQGLARMQEIIRQQTENALLQQEQRLQEAFRRQLQEALDQRDRSVDEKLQQHSRDTDEKTARVNEAVTAVALRLDEVNREVDERLAELQVSHFARGNEDADCCAEVEEQQARLEERMRKLETSVEKALANVFPRVECLLAQLETPGPSKTPTAPMPSHAAANASFPHESRASRPPSPARTCPPHCRKSCGTDGTSRPAEQKRLNHSRKELLEAAKEGRTDTVRELLDAGININFADSSGWTPLMWAAKKAHANLVSLLIERNADVNALTDKNSTALHAASFHDHSGLCVKLLIDAGANVGGRNKTGRQPLHYAVLNSNVAAAQALLEAGADKTAKDCDGHSPFDVAKTDAVRLLVQF
ncbi:hypothetical protein R5R35_003156 [Gryllus longicercus]|uniref:Uncharacterized protein n=1 Tax=Gryllus longicercus TaxID=2509291 RepID=A0AAN9VNQ6_9ORTH